MLIITPKCGIKFRTPHSISPPFYCTTYQSFGFEPKQYSPLSSSDVKAT